MASEAKNGQAQAMDIGALVDDGRVHRSVYTDPAIFEAEMTLLFGRAWIVLGHESQLPGANDFFTAAIGRQKLIVTRSSGGIAAYYNRCTHRGAALCVQERGNAYRFVCPYHGWTFDHDGQLLGVPAANEYAEGFDYSAHGLRSIARLETYRGFIFGNLSAEGPDLLTFLGPMRTTIDDFVDRAPEDVLEVVGTVHRHRYRGNWKAQFENLNDTVHPLFSHASSIAAAEAIAQKYGDAALTRELAIMRANGKPMKFFQEAQMNVAPFGHSFIEGHMGTAHADPDFEVYRNRLAAARGSERAEQILGVNRHLTLLYPSSTWQARFLTMKIILPISVDLTDTITYVFRARGAPDSLLEACIAYANMANSSASPIIADDLELYERCQIGNRVDGGDWVSMARGIVGDGSSEHPSTSEVYIRNQFAAWAAFMKDPM